MLFIGEELPHLGGPGMVHPHGAVHELHSIGLAGLDDGVELDGAEGDGLLKQHVLLLLGGEDGPVYVQAGGKRQVDGVDIRVVKDGLVGAIDLGVGWEVVGGREPRGLVERAAADGRDCGVGSKRDGARDLAGYLGAAYDSESDDRFRHFFKGQWKQCCSAVRVFLACDAYGRI